jgi:hypothetical protein
MSLLGLSTLSGVNVGSIARIAEAYSSFAKPPFERLETLRSQGLLICEVP